MTLAYRKHFQDAGFKRLDTGIAIVWAKDLDDTNYVAVTSEVRCDLDDTRPQEDWEPCSYYRFQSDCPIHDMGHTDNPLMALREASQITAPT